MRELPPLLVLFAVLLALPLLGFDAYLLHVIISSLIVALLAVSWNILGGFAGQISFGHAAFFGLGAYGAGAAALKLSFLGWRCSLGLWSPRWARSSPSRR